MLSVSSEFSLTSSGLTKSIWNYKTKDFGGAPELVVYVGAFQVDGDFKHSLAWIQIPKTTQLKIWLKRICYYYFSQFSGLISVAK